MSSLYKISEKLQEIFEELEEQGGEFTEEQLKELEITEEELKEKVDNYVKVIKEFKNSAEFCKKEKDNIYQRQKMFTNRVDRLKSLLLTAVQQFGKENKNNKFIETESCRISTKNTKSVELDELRLNNLARYVRLAVCELLTEKKLGEEKITCEEILDLVNDMYKKETYDPNKTYTLNDKYNLYTLNDLYNTPFELTFIGNIEDLLNNYRNAAYDFAISYKDDCKLEIVDKPDYKTALENNLKISVAKLITKQSLIIK